MPVFSIEKARASSAASKAAVLILDDEPSITTTLSLILHQAGYRAITARTGREAVEQARASSPDVLICDVVLPDGNGIDAARTIHGLCPGCQVILITGNPAAADLLEHPRNREFEVLAKPFHPATLLEKLDACTDAGMTQDEGGAQGATSTLVA